MSSALPEKHVANEEKGFSRGVFSFRSFLWTSKEKDISINKKSGLKNVYEYIRLNNNQRNLGENKENIFNLFINNLITNSFCKDF